MRRGSATSSRRTSATIFAAFPSATTTPLRAAAQGTGRSHEAVRLFPRHPGDHRLGRSRHRPPDLDGQDDEVPAWRTPWNRKSPASMSSAGSPTEAGRSFATSPTKRPDHGSAAGSQSPSRQFRHEPVELFLGVVDVHRGAHHVLQAAALEVEARGELGRHRHVDAFCAQRLLQRVVVGAGDGEGHDRALGDAEVGQGDALAGFSIARAGRRPARAAAPTRRPCRARSPGRRRP